jgi:hypothetical protein
MSKEINFAIIAIVNIKTPTKISKKPDDSTFFLNDGTPIPSTPNKIRLYKILFLIE